jgi:hypothetical protein
MIFVVVVVVEFNLDFLRNNLVKLFLRDEAIAAGVSFLKN